MSNPAVEIESPLVTQPEAQLPVRKLLNQPLIEQLLTSGNENPLEKIEALSAALDKLRRLSIRATFPQDWIIHVAKDREGNVLREVGYLQDCGCERAGKVWGIQITRPVIEREDFKDGTYSYNLLADAFSKVTGEMVENCEGSRWSGDGFFNRGEDTRIDPTDVRKSAWANLHGRAVRQLAGLAAVPLDVLEACGINLKQVVHIGYRPGARGGNATGAAVGGSDIKIRWGNGKDKTVAQQEDKDLAFYLRKAKEDLDKPDKARFRADNEALIAALEAEIEKRAKSKEQAAENPDSAPKAPATTAQKQLALRQRLTAVCKSVGGVTTLQLLTALVPNAKTLNDVPEDELDRLLAASEDDLMATASVLGERE